ncbi:hypothetical protein A2483_01250 [Candidatus Peregrinibacteria bacterium RIFOXYC2_FULL_33_13]|nr:MAG: hypothetical protein A2483_01250 [Candidatus Peregrinibacteria bacterium RIFOXYC2_FULL_33_13]
MQFQIPQDVQIEDKIIGPITMKQLIILAAGGGLDYVIYISLAQPYLWTVWLAPVAIIGIITLAISFFKINEVTFTKFILYLLSYYIRARKRTWQQMKGDVFNSAFSLNARKLNYKEKKIENKKKDDRHKFQKLQDLTAILDSHGKTIKNN